MMKQIQKQGRRTRMERGPTIFCVKIALFENRHIYDPLP
jgi:hypothetical protein